MYSNYNHYESLKQKFQISYLLLTSDKSVVDCVILSKSALFTRYY